MNHLLRALSILLLCSLLALSALAATPGDYGYYDANEDGKINVQDVLLILRAILNDPETDSNLLQVLRTAKTTTQSEPVEVMMVSVDKETETVTLSGDMLESFTVPFATLGLTEDTDFDALVGEEVTMTVPRPAKTFFENFDADKILAGRPQPLIEKPEVPTVPTVQDISFSPSGAYLKFTITPPADETDVDRYMLLLCEEGNDEGRIGWPVNAEYCEYIGLERLLPDVNYDTATVYAYDADGNTLSEYTETISVEHTDATVNLEAAYYEPLGGYGGVFFSEELPSAYVLSFYDADGNKMAFQNYMDAGSTVSDLYEYDGYNLADVAEVGIAHSKSVTVGENNALTVTTVGSERVALTEYPADMRLGAASNLHIDAYNCLAWDTPDYDFATYSELYLHQLGGEWIYVGMIEGDMYAVNSLPAGVYDKVRLYTVPAWDVRASYGYGVSESRFAFAVEDYGNTIPAVENVAFTASYNNVYVEFDEPGTLASPVHKLYLYNGSEWTGALATSYGLRFSLRNTDIAAGTYTKLRIVSTDPDSEYEDGVFEADCSLTVTANRGTATLHTYTLGDGQYAFYYAGLPTDGSVTMYEADTPSMTDWHSSFSLDHDQTGAGVRLHDPDPDSYFRMISFDEGTVTDTLTATFAYTTYSDWSKLTFATPATDNTIFTETGFKAVNGVPAFAYTPADADAWQQFFVHFSADGGETWVGMKVYGSTSVALGNREYISVEDTTTYNKVRIIRFADGAAKQYIADCNFTVNVAGTLTLPSAEVVYDENNGSYVLNYKGVCPAGASYVYEFKSNEHGSGWGSYRNYSESPADITVGDFADSPEAYKDYTVRIRIMQDAVMNGMTASVNIYDSGEVPAIAQ